MLSLHVLNGTKSKTLKTTCPSHKYDVHLKSFLCNFSEDDKHIGNQPLTPPPSAIEKNLSSICAGRTFPTKCDPVAHNVKMQCRGQREAANPLRHGLVCLQ